MLSQIPHEPGWLVWVLFAIALMIALVIASSPPRFGTFRELEVGRNRG
jgi:hypothetical protein